jgi:hypothetical protein
MFEKYRARRAAAAAARQAEAARAQQAAAETELENQRSALASMISLAEGPGVNPDGLVLHRGESCYGSLTNCSLVEERKGAGHFVAGSTGVSIPIGKIGSSPIRYRVGATRGHYVQGTPTPTAIGVGTVYFTNQRIVFLGTTQTRECAFDKLVGINQDEAGGNLTISVSNRQHPTVISYGASMSPWVHFHLSVALAHYHGTVDQLVAQLRSQLAELDPAPGATPA